MRHFLIALALLPYCAAHAQDDAPRPYQVEIIVFEHTEPFAAGEKFGLPESVSLRGSFTTPDPDTASFGDDSTPEVNEEDDIAPIEPRRIESFPEVLVDDLALAETARRLGNATRFRVLGHEGWVQPALSTDEAAAQRVNVGRVRGTILLSRSRYLRLDLDLSFSVDGQPVQLKQTRRRVQTGRPHYIDHPYLGLIVQVIRAP